MDMKNLVLQIRVQGGSYKKIEETLDMAFSLREKLTEIKENGTAALAAAVLIVDGAADIAIAGISDRVEEVQKKASRLRAKIGGKVEKTRAVVGEKTGALKEATVENLGRLGETIETKAAQVSTVTAAFGKTARKRLNLKKPVEAAVEAAKTVVAAEVPATAKKAAPKKKSTAKKRTAAPKR
jgi:hypothetical protein